MNWKVDYKDTKSEGRVNTTYCYHVNTKEEVIDFFGLNRPDVLWYEVSAI